MNSFDLEVIMTMLSSLTLGFIIGWIASRYEALKEIEVLKRRLK